MEQAGDLCECTDEEFDAVITAMNSKELIGVIAHLQEKMGVEQQRFNALSIRLSQISDFSSTEASELPNTLVKTQAKLSLLMDRNVKCFTQQAAKQNQEADTNQKYSEEHSTQSPVSTEHSSNSPDSGVHSTDLEHSSAYSANPEHPFTNSKDLQENYPLLEPPAQFCSEDNQLSGNSDTEKVQSDGISAEVTEMATKTSSPSNTGGFHANKTQKVWKTASSSNSATKPVFVPSDQSKTQASQEPVKKPRKAVRKDSSERAKAWGNVGKGAVQVRKKSLSSEDVIVSPNGRKSSTSDTESEERPKVWKGGLSLKNSSEKKVESDLQKSPANEEAPLSWTESKVNTSVDSDTLTITKTTVTKTVNYLGNFDRRDLDILDDPVSNENNKISISSNIKEVGSSAGNVKKTADVSLSAFDFDNLELPPKDNGANKTTQKTMMSSGSVSVEGDSSKLISKEISNHSKLKKTYSFGSSNTDAVTEPAQECSERIRSVGEITLQLEKLAESREREVKLEEATNLTESSTDTSEVSIQTSDKKVASTAIVLQHQTAQVQEDDASLLKNSKSDEYTFTVPVAKGTPQKIARVVPQKITSTTDKVENIQSMRESKSSLSDGVSGPGLLTHPEKTTGNENGDSNHGNGIIKSGIPPSIENEAAEDEKVQDRVTLRTWDPVGILKELYEIKLAQEDVDSACNMINMQGVMEKLPTNKKKATLLKTWKRRYFKLQDGHLYYYDESEPDPKNSACEKAQGFLKLMGGSIEELGGRIMGIDDGRGRYMVVRCSSDDSYAKWKAALETQIVDNIKTTYVKPVLNPSPHKTKKVVVVDIGSCSVRAGILGEQPSLPTLFFPCVVGLNKINKYRTFGFDAWRPDVRSRCTITYPVRPSVTIDKFSIDMESMPGLFTKIFRELKVEPSQYWVMLSAPANFNDKIKSEFMKILVDQFQVPGINMVSQSLLSLYAYNATSGIVVDVGERLEIVPVTDGYMIEGGISRQTYGGHRVAEELNKYLLSDNKFRFFTDVEFNIVRSLMEKTCYVAENYSEELKKFSAEPESCLKSISLDTYDLPPDTWTQIHRELIRHVEHDTSRFKSPEGLFNNDLWGMDNPSLQKLVHKAIQACPMDVRREMARSIYLSGGTTMLPGFPERLQAELTKVLPSSLVIQVHALPQRYHAAFIGACVMASHPAFERACITAAEWKKEGLKSLRKWQNF